MAKQPARPDANMTDAQLAEFVRHASKQAERHKGFVEKYSRLESLDRFWMGKALETVFQRRGEERFGEWVGRELSGVFKPKDRMSPWRYRQLYIRAVDKWGDEEKAASEVAQRSTTALYRLLSILPAQRKGKGKDGGGAAGENAGEREDGNGGENAGEEAGRRHTVGAANVLAEMLKDDAFLTALIEGNRSFKVRKSSLEGLGMQEASPCRYTHDTFVVLQPLALRRGSYPLSPKGLAEYLCGLLRHSYLLLDQTV